LKDPNALCIQVQAVQELLDPEDGEIMILKMLGSTEPVAQHPVPEDGLHTLL